MCFFSKIKLKINILFNKGNERERIILHNLNCKAVGINERGEIDLILKYLKYI